MKLSPGSNSTGEEEDLSIDKETNLSNKVFAVFDGKKNEKNLPQLVSELLTDQLETWRELADGYESLKTTKDREICCNGFFVRLRHNPLRAKSTMAAVDKGSVNERPCFLCLKNLPGNQKGILYRNTYLILCNPMPAFHSHLTIAAVDHRPQFIEANIDVFLQLMTDLGNSWTILYNGPECGASAPDHHHFQAIPAGLLPIEDESAEKTKLTKIAHGDGVSIYRVNNIGREILILEGESRPPLGSSFQGMISAMKENLFLNKEPMINVAGFMEEGEWRILIFPRVKHRPDAFFREGDERIVVSPAVIEMCGVIVTPIERDFKRLDAHDIENIYQEVSLKNDMSNFML